MIEFSFLKDVHPNYKSNPSTSNKHVITTKPVASNKSDGVKSPSSNSDIKNDNSIPSYNQTVLYDKIKAFENLKPNNRLRIVNNCLVLDNRILQFVRRTISRDSRISIIEFLENFREELSKEMDTKNAIHNLETVCILFKTGIQILKKTYSKDQKIIQRLEKLKI